MGWNPVPDSEREHFAKDGRAKRAFATAEEAQVLVDRLTPHAYICGRCGKYHVGKRAGAPKRDA